jgi:aryl-alcohol dehydrogenase-like predicted oxidoreductase
LDVLVPILLKLREEGKIRFLDITEAFVPDPKHQMLQRALEDDCWDVVMVGFNLLNQSARRVVFPKTLEKNIGVLVMFAVRRALSQPGRLKEVWAELVQKDLVNPNSCDNENPLGFLIQERQATTLPEAAYRFCRHEPGVHVVLTGTGNPEHLRANVESLVSPPLPEAVLHRLTELFRKVDCVTGN